MLSSNPSRKISILRTQNYWRHNTNQCSYLQTESTSPCIVQTSGKTSSSGKTKSHPLIQADTNVPHMETITLRTHLLCPCGFSSQSAGSPNLSKSLSAWWLSGIRQRVRLSAAHTHKTGWGCRAHDRSQTKSKDLPGPEPNLLQDIPLWSIVYCPKGKTRHLDMNSEVGKHWKISIMTNCVIALIHWVSQLKSEFHNVSFCLTFVVDTGNTGKHDIRWITTFLWDK